MSGLYVRSVVWDFILCAVASASLCYVLLDGFYVDESLQYSVIPAAGVIVCLLILFAIAQSKRTVLVGGILYTVALFVVWIASAAMVPDGAIFVDNETNYLIYTMVITLTATMCFLLSRSHVGTALLFIAGAFILGLIQLFYQRFELLWSILFVLCSLALVIYKNYQRSMRSALSVEKPSFAPGFLVSLAACAVAVGLAAVVWFGIISPLEPGALEIKLITEYRALETVQVRGTSDEFQTPNLDITSDQLNEDTRTTDDIIEDLGGTGWPATGETEEDPDDGESNSSLLGMNLDSLQDAFDFQSNPQNWPLLVVLGVIVLLVVAYFVSRRVRRNNRLKKFKELDDDAEYKQLFLYLLGRFRRLGIAIPNGQTMREFGVSSAAAVRFHDDESGVAFNDLAVQYSDMAYGKCPASEEDVSSIEAYYKSFWKAARKQLGSVKYFFKSFRL